MHDVIKTGLEHNFRIRIEVIAFVIGYQHYCVNNTLLRKLIIVSCSDDKTKLPPKLQKLLFVNSQ